jgi:hypothetical protein
MFWKRNNKEGQTSKLSGPRDIPEFVKKNLISNKLVDEETLPFLKAVIKGRENGDKATDIRIFDPADAEAREVKVQNYDTLNGDSPLVIAEGFYDDSTKKVELNAKRVISKIKFFTYDEILKQIESLKDPGSSVFIYTNAGTGVGGPLGRGAALIKVNTPEMNKKTKKYGVYGVGIVDEKPTLREDKIWDSDKPTEIAKWVSESHKARFC